MDEQASFEPRAVLASRRAGWNRLAIVVPALAFALTAWAGLSGPRPDGNQPAAIASTPAGPSSSSGPAATSGLDPALGAGYPAQVIGLDVRRLVDVERLPLGPSDVTAISGWFVATSITDCPSLAALYRESSLAPAIANVDSWAFCDRTGVLFASRPDLEQRQPTSYFDDNRSKSAGLPAVQASLVMGVIVPPALEAIGTRATPVVVVGRFLDPSGGCLSSTVCRRPLFIDHVAWAGLTEVNSDAATSGQPRLPADGVNVLTGG